MSLENPVIAVIGAGAVGGYYGARLAQHGFSVHLLSRTDGGAIGKSGMRIGSRDGDFSLSPEQIHGHQDSASMPPADLILVTLKTTANDQFEKLIRPILKKDSIILTLQNGLGNEQRLAELFGAERVLGGMAFVCINRTGPGEILHTDHGMIQLGEFTGQRSERAEKIAAIFSKSQVPCRVAENLMKGRWEKLVWNVPFNGLGALLDLSTDQLIGSAVGLGLVRQLMWEVLNIAAALGFEFPNELIEQKIEYTRSMGTYKSSTQIDRQKKRPLELEAIWGEPFRVGQRNGVSTSLLKTLYDMLTLIDMFGMAHNKKHIE
jgi:2-dehydropantoate 2-reductase